MGRSVETRAILRALGRGDNVILSGRYGIGRTRLIQHVAGTAGPALKFVFADFSDSLSNVARDLWIDIGQKRKSSVESMPFRLVVARLAAHACEMQNTVVVLDDIGKLTLPKIRFLQRLTLFGRMRYIAIVESFLPAVQFDRLKGCLAPSVQIELKHLSISDTCRYFEAVSKKHARRWHSAMIEGMADAARGYPLGMVEMAERELKR